MNTHAEAPLADLPKVLAAPPWIRGKPSRRAVRPVRVTMKERAAISVEHLAEQVTLVKEGKVDRVIGSPRVAVAMLDAMNVFGGWRSDFDARASQYFDEHVEATLLGLVPIAVGEGGPRRKLAERHVRRLAFEHGETVDAVATSYGKRARESVQEILACDRRYDCPNAAPQMPTAWRPEKLTRPCLRDGRPLPLVAVDRIGHMLAFSTLDRPYEGLIDVKAVCDLRSLAELAWELALAWDGLKKDQWMIESIAHIGDDKVIRRTTPAITNPTIVQVLGHAATDAAATELCTIAWRIKHEPGKPAHGVGSVTAAFATVARKRRVTVDEVEDSLMPTITIAASGDSDAPVSSRLATLRCKSMDARVRLDYGSRTIDVGFDERLDPFVESARGKLRDLPQAGDKDDPKKVAQAQEVWRELQEDVAAIADLRLVSLERAMVTGRRWSLDGFRRAWMDHPLMRHLSRSVVWRSGPIPFRIAQDGTFADLNDVELPTVAAVTVAHPAEMSVEERHRWSGVFNDYLLIQPIEQLSRRTVNAKTRALVPAEPVRQSEFYERLRSKRFDVSGQSYSRASARSSGRVRLEADVKNQMLVRVSVGPEVHVVDLSEVAHDLELVEAS